MLGADEGRHGVVRGGCGNKLRESGAGGGIEVKMRGGNGNRTVCRRRNVYSKVMLRRW